MATLEAKYKGKFRSPESFIGNYLKQGNEAQVKKSIETMVALKKEMKAAGIKDDPQGKAFYKEKKRSIKDYKLQHAEIADRKAMEAITRKVDGAKRWLETYMKQKNTAKVAEYRKQIETELSMNQNQLMSNAFGQRYFSEMSNYVNNLEEQMMIMELTAEGDKIARQLTSALTWVGTHLKRKDMKKTKEAWVTAQKAAEPIFANPMLNKVPSIQKAMMTYNEHASSLESNVGNVELEQEVEAYARKLKSSSHWIGTYLKQQNPNQTMMAQQKTAPMFEEFMAKFGNVNVKLAQDTIAEVTALFQRVELEVQPMLNAEQAKKLAAKLKSSCTWLNTYLNKKDVNKVAEYQQGVHEGMAMLSQFSNIPVAAEGLASAQALLNRVDSEMGDIVAGIEIERLSRPIHSSIQWLLSSLKRKDVKSTQSYQAKLLEQLPEIQRYAQYPSATEIINKANQAMNTVTAELGDVIAQEEIRSLIGKLTSPISWLESALKNKDVDAVLKNRERLVPKVMPLRARYATHPAAMPTLQKVDDLLNRIESEIGTIIADKEVDKVERKVYSAMKWAEGSLQNKDARSGLKHLQEMTRLLLPLEASFGSYPRTQQLRTQVDDITNRLGPLLGDMMGGKAAEKPLKDCKKALDAVQKAVSSGDNMLASKLLKPANTAAQPLRKSYSFVPEVRQTLLQLDEFNMSLLGGVPQMEIMAPILDVNWKLPTPEQDLLKKINGIFEHFNSSLSAAKTLFDECVVLDGTGGHPIGIDKFEKLLIGPSPYHSDHPALAEIQKAKPLVDELEKLHADLPAVNQAREAIEVCDKLARDKFAFFSSRAQYAACMMGAQNEIEMYKRAIARAEKNPDDKNCPDFMYQALEKLNGCFAYCNKARSFLPEDYDEAAGLMEYVDTTKNSLIAQIMETTMRLWEKFARASEWYDANQLERFLKEKFPSANEVSAMANIKAGIEKEQAALAAEKKAEAERKQREREEANERKREEYRVKWIYPYNKPGTAMAGKTKWDWKPSEKGGTVTAGGFSWKVYATTAGIQVSGNSDFGWVDFNDHKDWTYEAHAPRFGIVWRSVEWNESGSLWESKYDGHCGSWKYSPQKLEMVAAAPKNLHGTIENDNIPLTGTMPPYIALMAALVPSVIGKIKPWRAARVEYDRLYQAEDSRRTDIWRNAPSSCSICNTGGSNMHTCYDPSHGSHGHYWCSNCTGTDRCGCDAFYDTHPHVLSSWESETQQRLGIY